MKNMVTTRTRLKKCQPYFIEKELIDKLYLSDEVNAEGQKIEYWIFFFAFIRRLSDTAIGIRLGYTRQGIFLRTNKIIEKNLYLIEKFLKEH